MSGNKINTLDKFMRNCQQSGTVWGLHSELGWVVCSSSLYDDTKVIPFWTSEDAAESQCIDEWSAYKPIGITTEEFIDIWLIEMANDNVMLGIDWDKNLVGEEIDPIDMEAAYLRSLPK